MRNPISNPISNVCQKMRREIEEADPGEPLSLAASTHLESCAACETLAREQTSLQAIMSSLGTVEAPGDFDFRLRARLAGERSGSSRPLAMGDFSFGFRSAAAAMVLFVIAAAFVAVTLRTRLGSPSAGDGPVALNPIVSSGGAQGAGSGETSEEAGTVTPDESKPGKSSSDTPARRRTGRDEIAKADDRHPGTLDSGFTRAPVYNATVNSYPGAAFPIEASFQSLKMSVDDGRGTSRTISLPTVSFGSQQTLSQDASPLVASSRGAW